MSNETEIKRLQDKIDKIREEINYWLHKDVPIDFLNIKIRMLSNQNESWIQRIKELSHE